VLKVTRLRHPAPGYSLKDYPAPAHNKVGQPCRPNTIFSWDGHFYKCKKILLVCNSAKITSSWASYRTKTALHWLHYISGTGRRYSTAKVIGARILEALIFFTRKTIQIAAELW